MVKDLKEKKDRLTKSLFETVTSVMKGETLKETAYPGSNGYREGPQALSPDPVQGGIQDLTGQNNVGVPQHVNLNAKSDPRDIMNTKALNPEVDKPEEDEGNAPTDGQTMSPSAKTNQSVQKDKTLPGTGNNSEPMKSFTNMDVMAMFQKAVEAQLKDWKPVTGSMSEQIQELFKDEVELSEDFKKKAGILFESAVFSKYEQYKDKLFEIMLNQFQESMNEYENSLAEAVDQYTSYVAEEFMAENKPVIQTNLKVQLMEEFMEGLKKVFIENYLDIPSEKIDVLESMALKIAEKDAQLNEEFESNVKLKAEILEFKKQNVFNLVVKGLSDIQTNKLKKLTESLEYENLDQFKEKLEILKESIKTDKLPLISESKLTSTPAKVKSIEEIELNAGPVVAEEKILSSEMKQYTSFLDRTRESPTARDVIRVKK